MFPGFLAGLLGGMAAAKLVGACRRGGGGCHTDAGGSCGRGGWGGYGRGGWAGPGGGRWPLFRLVHELHLSRDQWHQAHDILHDLRSTLHQSRSDAHASLAPLLSLLAAPSFDAAQAEQVAKGHDATFQRIRGSALTTLERLHAILTPEQRDRLRQLIAQQQ